MGRSIFDKPWIRFVTDEVEAGGGGSGEDQPADESRLDDFADGDESADGEAEDVDGDGPDDEEGFDRERALRKIKKVNAENKALRERAKKAEQQSETVNQSAEAETQALKAQIVRLEVANELGLPVKLASRLTGSTREEVMADAEDLVSMLGPRRPGGRKPGNEFGEGHSKKQVVEEIDFEDMVSKAIHN